MKQHSVAYNSDEEKLIEEVRQQQGLATKEEAIAHLVSTRLREKLYDMVGRWTNQQIKRNQGKSKQ